MGRHIFGGPPPSPRKPTVYAETRDQKEVVKWLRARPDWMVMRLENAARRTPAQAARDQAMGMLTGAPDLVLLWRREVVFLEMKKAKGGVVRPDQAQCHIELEARGQVVLVGHGHVDAIAQLEAFQRSRDLKCRGCGIAIDYEGVCSSGCTPQTPKIRA